MSTVSQRILSFHTACQEENIPLLAELLLAGIPDETVHRLYSRQSIPVQRLISDYLRQRQCQRAFRGASRGF